MKKAIRILLALTVAMTCVGGAFAGSAAATDYDADNDYQAIGDNDLVDLNVNAGNVDTATAVNAANLGGSQTAIADADQTNYAGDSFWQDA